MSDRKPLKVSGLLQSGKISRDPNAVQLEEFGARTGFRASSTGPLQIALADIDDSPYQPRTLYDPIEIDNLAHSLAAAGLKEPVLLRAKSDGRHELIYGHRRTRAGRNLGWTEIAAYVVTHSDREAELAAMVSNEARVDLTDYERGMLYRRSIASRFAATQTDIANLFGTTQGRVSRCMAMLKLPDTYLVMLDQKPDLFGSRCAEDIAHLLKEYPAETALIEDGVHRITEEGADQKSVKQWVQQMVKQKHNTAGPKEHAVVTDRAGRAMFTAKRAGREVTIRIQATEIEAKEVEEIVLAALRKRAEKVFE